MQHHDLTTSEPRARRAGVAVVVGAVYQVAMLRRRSAIIRTPYVSD